MQLVNVRSTVLWSIPVVLGKVGALPQFPHPEQWLSWQTTWTPRSQQYAGSVASHQQLRETCEEREPK